MCNIVINGLESMYKNITPYHLRLILIYLHQHLLPPRSALHHDDHSHLPHTMELHLSIRSEGIEQIKHTSCNHLHACVQQYACWMKVKRRDEGGRKDNGGHEKTSPK